jgi:hypothetical protein
MKGTPCQSCQELRIRSYQMPTSTLGTVSCSVRLSSLFDMCFVHPHVHCKFWVLVRLDWKTCLILGSAVVASLKRGQDVSHLIWRRHENYAQNQRAHGSSSRGHCSTRYSTFRDTVQQHFQRVPERFTLHASGLIEVLATVGIIKEKCTPEPI